MESVRGKGEREMESVRGKDGDQTCYLSQSRWANQCMRYPYKGSCLAGSPLQYHMLSHCLFFFGFFLFFFFLSFFFVPSYTSGGHHVWLDFYVCDRFFYPTIEVVTFCLRGWITGVTGPRGGWNSSVGSVFGWLSYLMQCCAFNPPLSLWFPAPLSLWFHAPLSLWFHAPLSLWFHAPLSLQ